MNRGQSFLLLLIGIVAIVTLLVVLPFLEYVIAAAIFGYVLYPLHERLERRIGSLASALTLIGSSVVAVFLPVAYITFVFVGDLLQIAEGESDLDVAAIETRIFELTGQQVDLAVWLRSAGQAIVDVLFGGVGAIVSSLLKASLGAALMLFLVYYVLREGDTFVGWIRETIPLPADVTDDLVAKIDAMTWGVVIGHISVALLQAVVGGIGLYLAGVPNVVFWTFVMAVLALLPLIGAFLVWGPAAAYLVLINQVVPGIFLILYGVVVVSMIDNYARPLVIDKQAHLNPGVILVGVFGGVYSIGFTGLFVGPIVIGVLAATLETFRADYDRI